MEQSNDALIDDELTNGEEPGRRRRGKGEEEEEITWQFSSFVTGSFTNLDEWAESDPFYDPSTRGNR